MYPELFCYFSVVQIAYWDGPQIIKKPNPVFFKNYLEKYEIDPATVLFIDDKQYNIDAATTIGIAGNDFKNPKDLMKILKERDIIL